MLQLFEESNSNQIPAQQGLYAFFIDSISPSKIGLQGIGPWSTESLEKAKATLIDRCQKQIQILNSLELNGLIGETEKDRHLQISYAINAYQKSDTDLIEEIENIPLGMVREYASFMHSSAIMSQPIYVGIAVAQTLKERYKQHKRSYYSDQADQNIFGARLRKNRIGWDDLIFGCIPLNSSEEVKYMLPALEKHLHAITHPVLSIR